MSKHTYVCPECKRRVVLFYISDVVLCNCHSVRQRAMVEVANSTRRSGRKDSSTEGEKHGIL